MDIFFTVLVTLVKTLLIWLGLLYMRVSLSGPFCKDMTITVTIIHFSINGIEKMNEKVGKHIDSLKCILEKDFLSELGCHNDINYLIATLETRKLKVNINKIYIQNVLNSNSKIKCSKPHAGFVIFVK